MTSTEYIQTNMNRILFQIEKITKYNCCNPFCCMNTSDNVWSFDNTYDTPCSIGFSGISNSYNQKNKIEPKI